MKGGFLQGQMNAPQEVTGPALVGHALDCRYCGRPAVCVGGDVIYTNRPDLAHRRFWLCAPCGAWVGCHKDQGDKPLGYLANAALRALKSSTHELFDPLWREGGMRRKDAYLWLSRELGIEPHDCHIGMFDEDLCRRAIAAIHNRKRPKAPPSRYGFVVMAETKDGMGTTSEVVGLGPTQEEAKAACRANVRGNQRADRYRLSEIQF